MLKFKEKKTYHRFLYSRYTIVLLVLLIVFATRATIGILRQERATRENKIIADQKIDELKLKKTQFAKSIKNLQTERGVETEIRKKFRVAREGENMIVLLDTASEQPHEQPIAEPKYVEQTSSFFLSLWNKFFGDVGRGKND